MSTLTCFSWFIIILICFTNIIQVTVTESSNLCSSQSFNSTCQCYEQYEEQPFAPQTNKLHGLLVECSNLTSEEFYHDISHISHYFIAVRNLSIYSVQVKDANLGQLTGLPPGLDGLKHLTVDNTGIDLEQIRESSESLGTLKMFRVSREKFTEIPENFFTDLHGLNVLALNDVGIKAISENGFRFLEDSLKSLSLRNNMLRSIPLAIATLSNVEAIDLSGNQIRSVTDDNTKSLESGLKSLMTLNIDTIDCTCKLTSSLFIDWVRSHAIHGVKCASPARFKGWDISSAPTEDFCMIVDSTGSSINEQSYSNIIYLLIVQIILLNIIFM